MKRVLAAAAVVVGLVGLVSMAGAVTVINNWCTSTYVLVGTGGATASSGLDSAVVRALNPPNIVITKFATNLRTNDTQPYSVAAIQGDTISFKMYWVNAGEATADTVILYDYLPAGMTIGLGSNNDTEANCLTGVSAISGSLISFTATTVNGTDSGAAASGAFWYRAKVN